MNADVEGAPLDDVAPVLHPRPGLEADGYARLATPRHPHQLVQAAVPEERVHLGRDDDVGAGGAQGVRVAEVGVPAQDRDGRRSRRRILAQAADRAGRARERPVEHDQVGGEGPGGLQAGGDVGGEGTLDVGAPEDSPREVVPQVDGRDDQDLGHREGDVAGPGV
jgi:hypothetical protein